jgi:hypothetical protein
MADSQKFEASLQRFEQALKLVEKVMVKKREEEKRLRLLETDKASLTNEKLRMDREMALVRNKAQELVNTSKQAAGKIDSAMARIRQVLHSNSSE